MTDTPPAYLRKDAHIDLARQSLFQGHTHPMDRIEFPYTALPECNLSDIRLDRVWLGRQLSAPLMISAMTGGTERADRLNIALVELAQELKLAIGLGSQRANLENKNSQAELRQLAPSIPLIGNLGAIQIKGDTGLDLAKRAAADIEADALAIHLNPLQEALQPEGETDFRYIADAIARCADALPCPVIVKEVGAGLSAAVVRQLAGLGIEIIDIAGRGGTNWAEIEQSRHMTQASWLSPFTQIGIDTPDALRDARSVSAQLNLIASGGIRDGLDAAKAFLLGADMVGCAGIVLRAMEDENRQLTPQKAHQTLTEFTEQLRLACFLAGKTSPIQLKGSI